MPRIAEGDTLLCPLYGPRVLTNRPPPNLSAHYNHNPRFLYCIHHDRKPWATEEPQSKSPWTMFVPFIAPRSYKVSGLLSNTLSFTETLFALFQSKRGKHSSSSSEDTPKRSPLDESKTQNRMTRNRAAAQAFRAKREEYIEQLVRDSIYHRYLCSLRLTCMLY